jgi:hypothetical protein
MMTSGTCLVQNGRGLKGCRVTPSAVAIWLAAGRIHIPTCGSIPRWDPWSWPTIEDHSAKSQFHRMSEARCLATGPDDLGPADARAPKPIFADDTILLQPVTRASLSLSAGLIAFVEASGRSTAKNRLCHPNARFDWIRHLLSGMRTEMEWQGAPDVQTWVETSRLNLVKGLDQHPDRAVVADLQRRFVTALFPALAKLDVFASRATPAERAQIFQPIA